MDKRVSCMGDAVAVAITKVVAGESLDASTIGRLLVILQTAFSAPQIVKNETDRTPRTALFILNSLDHQTSSPEQKRQIAQFRGIQKASGRTVETWDKPGDLSNEVGRIKSDSVSFLTLRQTAVQERSGNFCSEHFAQESRSVFCSNPIGRVAQPSACAVPAFCRGTIHRDRLCSATASGKTIRKRPV
jgi:hypothetical protein